MYNDAADPTTDPGGTGTGATPPTDPWTAEELAAARAWANEWYSAHKIPATYGTADDLYNNYMAQRRAGLSHQDAMTQVPKILGWDKYTPETTTTPPTTPTPTPTPGPGGTNGPLTKPFDQTFTAPGSLGIPGFPAFPDLPKFALPTAADVLADPGHAFRLSEGTKALENWAAAKGTLNDSDTAKGLQAYGQNLATQDYNDVFNRKWGIYKDDIATRYLTPWAAQVNTLFPTEAAFNQHSNDVNYANARNAFLTDRDYFSNWQDRVFSKLFNYANA